MVRLREISGFRPHPNKCSMQPFANNVTTGRSGFSAAAGISSSEWD